MSLLDLVPHAICTYKCVCSIRGITVRGKWRGGVVGVDAYQFIKQIYVILHPPPPTWKMYCLLTHIIIHNGKVIGRIQGCSRGCGSGSGGLKRKAGSGSYLVMSISYFFSLLIKSFHNLTIFRRCCSYLVLCVRVHMFRRTRYTNIWVYQIKYT